VKQPVTNTTQQSDFAIVEANVDEWATDHTQEQQAPAQSEATTAASSNSILKQKL